jgi:hypothetical protein
VSQTVVVAAKDTAVVTVEKVRTAVVERAQPFSTVVTRGVPGPPGPPGPGGGSTYTHTQAIPLAVWTAAHNLGRYPSVSVVDTLGRQVFGDVTWVDENIVQITHGSAIAGKAYFN